MLCFIDKKKYHLSSEDDKYNQFLDSIMVKAGNNINESFLQHRHSINILCFHIPHRYLLGNNSDNVFQAHLTHIFVFQHRNDLKTMVIY